MASTAESDEPAWFLRSSVPVLFPSHDAFTKSDAEFDRFLADELRHGSGSDVAQPASHGEDVDMSDTFTLVSASIMADIRQGLADQTLIEQPDDNQIGNADEIPAGPPVSRLMDGLHQWGEGQVTKTASLENKMLTDNGDLTNRSSLNNLVDLFYELEEAVSGPRLHDLLQAAWATDPIKTLKIIFNSRSIHRGKSSRNTFYRSAGWLSENHPLTLMANLRWLTRPIIQKRLPKIEDGDEDIVVVEIEKDEADPSKYDVRNGLAHGYWKDLLNLLALAANDNLGLLSDPRKTLNQTPGSADKEGSEENDDTEGQHTTIRASLRRRGRGRGRRRAHASSHRTDTATTAGPLETGQPVDAVTTTQAEQRRKIKELKRQVRETRHDGAITAFNTKPVYRALHLTVARLFAAQLVEDIDALRGNDTAAKRNISLCGKWAPSHDRFHDRHTFVVSSIAEIMYPRASLADVVTNDTDREIYLRHARERYRRDVSALRKHLGVVERDITAKAFHRIKYDRLPSVAMKNYTKLFIEKDFDHFSQYLDKVCEGTAEISGATLLPSTFIQQIRRGKPDEPTAEELSKWSMPRLLQYKQSKLEEKVIDGQWKTMVQRIKDSGQLSSSIAVCDVSGSMEFNLLSDRTFPLDSAIGLSLVISEITEPPFGGSFITFTRQPEIVKLDNSAGLLQRVRDMNSTEWGMNTDFAAVFQRLILPVAVQNKLTKDEMVKRVFVFCDMEFDAVQPQDGTWASSYETIKKDFEAAGYDLPELIFWNLAGPRVGGRDGTAPKPVVATEPGTSLVSGYSPNMVKMFLENGTFGDVDEDEESESEGEGDDSGSDGVVDVTATDEAPTAEKTKKTTPLSTVKKAISHKAYSMLKVLD